MITLPHPSYSNLDDTSNRRNLLLLCLLRLLAMTGQLIAIGIVHYVLDIHLPLLPMLLVLMFLAALNMGTFIYYRSTKPVSPSLLFLSLLLDVLALAMQFYFSGGATNPFVGLFLLPVVIAAILLHWHYSWIITSLTLGCYLCLSFFYIEIPHLHHYHLGAFFNLHIHGMFISYGLSALLVSYFIIRMSHNLRERDRALADMKTKQLHEEQSMLLGMLAAGAAHELGTPLSTISLLSQRYQNEATSPEAKRRADILYDQAMRCKAIISHITAKAGAGRAESGRPLPVNCFIDEVITQFRTARPEAPCCFSQSGTEPIPVIQAEYALIQALINLLNNAADASPAAMHCMTIWTATCLTITIEDEGEGISPTILDSLGQLGTTTKPHGLGMGLYLAYSVISRMNGTLTLENRINGGAKACVTLPLMTIQ